MTSTKRIAFTLGAAALAALLLEGGSRAILALANRVPAVKGSAAFPAAAPSDLNDYQTVDPRRPSSWVLRPGIRQTLRQAIAAKERSGRTLAAGYFRARAAVLGLGPDAPVLEINADGFRGPELDPAHSRPRILALGDSCTFGTFPESATYPRALEAELARRGVPVEVVNGGVEGYSPHHVLARIEDYVALRPEVTTLYLGWNALFAEPPPGGAGPRSPFTGSAALLRKAGVALRGTDPRRRAAEALTRPKRPDPSDPALAAIAAYTPAFIADVERIAAAMDAAGSRVVILTLPGLFDGTPPTAAALAMGHLPEFTDNPHVLAAMTARANDALRELAARNGYPVVDLARWSGTALNPRHAWFFDSVHLHERGQAAIGAFLAAELVRVGALPAQRWNRSSTTSNLPRSQASRSAFLRSNSAT